MRCDSSVPPVSPACGWLSPAQLWCGGRRAVACSRSWVVFLFGGIFVVNKYNVKIAIFFSVYNSAALSTLTVLCEQPHYFQNAVFITPNSTSMRQQLPVPTPPCPGEPSDVPCLWEGAYSRHCVEADRLCPSCCTSFAWCDVFQVSPWCSTCQHFIPFYV